jgi:hypothetical protein
MVQKANNSYNSDNTVSNPPHEYNSLHSVTL